jgi:probable HAF family extracellular repeat protein
MKSRILACIGITVFTALAMPVRPEAQEQSAQEQKPEPARYTVMDLGTLGGTYSFGFGINNAGEVAGAAATSAQTDGFAATAFLWTKRKGISNLGVLGPPLFPACPTCNSGAAGVGALGEVAMGSEIATLDPNDEDFGQWDPLNPTHRVTRGAIWRNGVMTALPNLPGGNNASPFWINNLGQVSGVAESEDDDPTCSIGPNGPSEPNGLNGPNLKRGFLPVIWGPDGSIHRLSPLVSKGDTVANAFTINDHGEAVGNSGLCSTTGLPPFAINFSTASHAVLWESDGSVHDLGSLGGAFNGASSINNRGEGVGTAQSPKDGTNHAFLWTRQTGMLDYGAFPGAAATVVGCCHTNNDRGEIVGFSVEPANPYGGRALIWQGTEPKDLNDFVRDPGPFVQLTGAFSINDAGEIVCQGVINTGEVHACLAVPNSGAALDESVSPATWQLGSPMPLSENARELLRRRLGMPWR